MTARTPRLWLISLLAAAGIALVGCVSTDLSPIGSTRSFAPEDDERRLWQALRQAEDKVLPTRAAFEDPALEKYLTEIARKVTPSSYITAGGQPITVKVRKDPRLNAAAMAHGLIIVHTGLVARAENEGQLAAILGHEVAHITHRHSIRKRREAQNQETAVNLAAFVGTLALAAAAVDQSYRGNYGSSVTVSELGQPLLALGLNLTHTAMVSGYSRDMEREADEAGLKAMAEAGYDPRELARMFRHMMAESPDRGRVETFFWGSHPRLSERIEAVEQAARAYPMRNTSSTSSFERETARVRLNNAAYDAYLGRSRLADDQIKRVMSIVSPSRRTSLEPLWRGHAHRSASAGARNRKDERTAEWHFATARASYQKVAKMPGVDQASAYRGLAELYFANRDQKSLDCEAKAAYSKFLELQPATKDSADIKTRLTQLRC